MPQYVNTIIFTSQRLKFGQLLPIFNKEMHFPNFHIWKKGDNSKTDLQVCANMHLICHSQKNNS